MINNNNNNDGGPADRRRDHRITAAGVFPSRCFRRARSRSCSTRSRTHSWVAAIGRYARCCYTHRHAVQKCGIFGLWT